MDGKEKFDAFMRLAEFQQVSLERRIGIEWKMTTVLWTAIFVGTGYLKSQEFPVPTNFWILYASFLLVYFLWLGFLGKANKIDKEFKEYYRNQAEHSLNIAIEKLEHPIVRKRLYWGAWLWLELTLTAGFLLSSYLFLFAN